MLESLLEDKTTKKGQSCCPFLTIEFYQEYFDVKTRDITYRLRSALFPFSSHFAVVTKEKPDFYGPFWIYTTLIFVLAIAGNLSSYLAANFYEPSKEATNLHFDFVPSAATVVYGFGIAFPVVLTVVMKIFGSETTFAYVICVYGYSFTIFIPLIICCSYPSAFFQWISLIYGTVNSTIFLLLNFNRELKAYIPKSRFLILLLILAAQLAVFLVFRLKFFSTIYSTVVQDVPEIFNNFPIGPSNTTTDATTNSTTA